MFNYELTKNLQYMYIDSTINPANIFLIDSTINLTNVYLETQVSTWQIYTYTQV